MDKVIKSYKGFGKNMQCRGFQFKEGKEYETDNAKVCESGFHGCEYPLDVFGHYPPANSIFRFVEQSGNIDKNTDDSKIASTRIKIGAEINLKSLVEYAIKFTFSKVKWTKKTQTTGNQAASQSTGNRAASQSTGYRAMSCVNGFESQTSITDNGKIKSTNGVAMGIGVNCIAAAPKDCWIVLAESEKDKNGVWDIISVKSVKVDGKKIKANTFYTLKNGKFVTVKD
jgi:hypothetical protein